MLNRVFRSIDVPTAFAVVCSSGLVLSACAPESVVSPLLGPGGSGAPNNATAGTLARGGSGATAGTGVGVSAGMTGSVMPPLPAPAGAGSGAPASAGRASVGGAAAIGGMTAAVSGGAGAAGSVAAANGETGRMVGITAAHNAVRARIMNPAPNPALPPLTWSTELATIAQAWANKLAAGGDCLDLVHSMSNDLGENLSGTTGGMVTPKEVVERWAAEEQCYTFGVYKRTDKCDMTCAEQKDASGCGHYTQVVWRDTTQVGCGMATCGSGRRAGEVWVCNYKAPGNTIGDNPY